MIVPLLAVVTLLSPLSHGQAGWQDVLVAVAALLMLLGVSRWGLNPFFALLARATNPRGADGRCAARGPGRGVADGRRVLVDGDGGIPCRSDAVELQLPAPDRERHRRP
jgi:hypothetical protein